jgi:hypothetical protein
MSPSQEPAVDAAPVRRFKDAACIEVAPRFPGFPDLVEATWRAMVAGFVAAEGQLFNDTETIA